MAEWFTHPRRNVQPRAFPPYRVRGISFSVSFPWWSVSQERHSHSATSSSSSTSSSSGRFLAVAALQCCRKACPFPGSLGSSACWTVAERERERERERRYDDGSGVASGRWWWRWRQWQRQRATRRQLQQRWFTSYYEDETLAYHARPCQFVTLSRFSYALYTAIRLRPYLSSPSLLSVLLLCPNRSSFFPLRRSFHYCHSSLSHGSFPAPLFLS